MADHPNAQRLREGYEAFAKGDIDTVMGLMTDDAVWHVTGAGPLVGDYKGQDEITGFFGQSFELSGGTLQIELHDVLANDEHAAALVTTRAKRDDRSFEMNAVHIYHMRDGKVSEFWGFNEDDRRAEEFWA